MEGLAARRERERVDAKGCVGTKEEEEGRSMSGERERERGSEKEGLMWGEREALHYRN